MSKPKSKKTRGKTADALKSGGKKGTLKWNQYGKPTNSALKLRK
jgi:hypothetical protein